jgi:hypothetical protein
MLSLLTFGVFFFIVYEFSLIFFDKLNPSLTSEIKFYNITSEGALKGDSYGKHKIILAAYKEYENYINFSLTNSTIIINGVASYNKTLISKCNLTDIVQTAPDEFENFNVTDISSKQIFFCFNLNDYALTPQSLYKDQALINVDLIVNNDNNQTLYNKFPFSFLYYRLGFSPNNYENPFYRLVNTYSRIIAINTFNKATFFYQK